MYDKGQQGLPLGRVVKTYLFIEFAEGTLGTLETRRSVNFVVYEVAN